MREFINNVKVAGILVKHTLEETTYEKNNNTVECIRGEVVIRTADDGEHTVKYFANRYTKDGNESKVYKALQTVINEYRTLEEFPDDPDYVEITSAHFGVNDYMSSNKNEVVSFNTVSANFINRIEKSKLETTPLTATFEVEGVIASITDEIIKNEPTGNVNVTMNVITQIRNGNGKSATFEVNDMFPLKMVVPADLADTFKGIYSEGGFTKFTGVLINRAETKTVVEKQAFGGDVTKTFTNTVRRIEILTGVNPVDIYSVELTDDICSQLIAKRKAKIDEVKNGTKKSSGDTSTTTNTTTSSNPFANKNPFAK